MVHVLNEGIMLLSYDNVPCISFSNKIGVLITCRVYVRPGLGVDHPPASSTEVSERVELYLFPPTPRAFVASSRVTFTFTMFT